QVGHDGRPNPMSVLLETVVGEEWIVRAAEADIEPGGEAQPLIAGLEVVAEVIMPARRPNEEGAVEALLVDDVTRLIDEGRPRAQKDVERDGRGQQDAVMARIVPEK